MCWEHPIISLCTECGNEWNDRDETEEEQRMTLCRKAHETGTPCLTKRNLVTEVVGVKCTSCIEQIKEAQRAVAAAAEESMSDSDSRDSRKIKYDCREYHGECLSCLDDDLENLDKICRSRFGHLRLVEGGISRIRRRYYRAQRVVMQRQSDCEWEGTLAREELEMAPPFITIRNPVHHAKWNKS